MTTLAAICTLMLALCGVPLAEAALSWTNHPGGRSAPVSPIGSGKTGFTALTPEASGILFTNSVPNTRHLTNQILLNGSGVAAGDLDGDGSCDLIFGGLGGRSAIYRNLGHWRFEDVTARSGVDLTRLDVTGVVAADYDGDNDLDLIINTIGQGTFILDNQGDGRFVSSRSNVGLNRGRNGTSSALADVDGDGQLDLYIANYRVTTMRDEPHRGFTIRGEAGKPRVTAYGDQPITSPELSNRFKFHYEPTPNGGATVFHDEQGEPDLFLRNLGGGRLVPFSVTNGTFRDSNGAALGELPTDWGLSVMLRDLNGDRAPDLYVCNDFGSPDRIWINDGQGHFRPTPPTSFRQTSLSSMAVDVADLDRDGFDDIFTADMLSPDRWRRLVQIYQLNPQLHRFVDLVMRGQSPRNALQRNRGDGTYAEVAQMMGLEASDWSWASIFLDVDLDGYEDLLVANGFERDFMNQDAHRRVRAAQGQVPRGAPSAARMAVNRFYPRLATANLAFRNLGHLRFTELGKEWGFDIKSVAHGMCLADLDNDGDLDVIINNFESAATLLRNDSSRPRIAVRLRGRPPNTRGIGATIRLHGGTVKQQSQEIIAGGRYLSGDEAQRVFAPDESTNALAIEVLWRRGVRTLLSNVTANRVYEIAEESSSPPQPVETGTDSTRPLFEDVTASLGHAYPHPGAEDFAGQPHLPQRMDTLGPGISWIDLDQDGWDDLILPCGQVGGTKIYRNNKGRLLPEGRWSLTNPVAHVENAVVGWAESERGVTTISALAALPKEAHAHTLPALESRMHEAPARRNFPFPANTNSTGPLALADIDGDGDLDLFLGGRWTPGRWPEPASSRLFLRQQDQWIEDSANSNLFRQVGLVSGAVFTDLDGDHDPDLVLACHWGPLRLFTNHQGRFTPSDRQLSHSGPESLPATITNLSGLTGWWTGITAGDFDGDGRMDLVAANWGLNSKFQRFRSQPLRVYFGDLAGNDTMCIVESWFDPVLGKYAPILDVWSLSRSLPWLLTRFDSYDAFSRVGIEQALGQYFARARYHEAAVMHHVVLLDRGMRFDVRMLPAVAQEAPAFATCVADFDGDGREDLFLSQNFFGVRADTSRYDAGRGLLLLGQGDGTFRPQSAQQSGIAIYGEQRGAAVADFDADGRVDLAVAEMDASARLYRNSTARAGVRVRLRGKPQNQLAIGAQLRTRFGDAWGPAREIHAGSGYWSQDSVIQVMARPEGVSKVQIRWPDGKVTESQVGLGATEVVLDAP